MTIFFSLSTGGTDAGVAPFGAALTSLSGSNFATLKKIITAHYGTVIVAFLLLKVNICLDGDDLMFDYDPELIQDCSNRLMFDTVNIFLRSKDMDPEQLDKVRFNQGCGSGSA